MGLSFMMARAIEMRCRSPPEREAPPSPITVSYPSGKAVIKSWQQVDAASRPDLFAPLAHYMPRESFENLLANDNVLALLATEHGRAVGCCFVSLLERSISSPGKTAYIDLLVVDAPCRHRGIGRALFAEVEKCARKFGAQRVELIMWSHNAIAQKAYAAYGMTLQRSIDEIAL